MRKLKEREHRMLTEVRQVMLDQGRYDGKRIFNLLEASYDDPRPFTKKERPLLDVLEFLDDGWMDFPLLDTKGRQAIAMTLATETLRIWSKR